MRRTAFGNLSGTPEQHISYQKKAFEYVNEHFANAQQALERRNCTSAYSSLMVAQFYLGHAQAHANFIPYNEATNDAFERLAEQFDDVDAKFVAHCTKGRSGVKPQPKITLNGLNRRRRQK
jgi:hypothetical protein